MIQGEALTGRDLINDVLSKLPPSLKFMIQTFYHALKWGGTTLHLLILAFGFIYGSGENLSFRGKWNLILLTSFMTLSMLLVYFVK